MDMVKFAGENDDGHRAVRGTLKAWVKGRGRRRGAKLQTAIRMLRKLVTVQRLGM